MNWYDGSTKNKTITYATAFTNTTYAILGAGFVIEGVGQQHAAPTITTLKTSSTKANCGTEGVLCIGT